MAKKISRRSFLEKSSVAGAASFVSFSAIPFIANASLPSKNADIAVVEGKNYYENTRKAIELIGGIREFVKKGQIVGLLINSDFEEYAAFVNPDIAMAVVDECVDAGASEIICLQMVKDEYWKKSKRYNELSNNVNKLTNLEFNTFPAKYDEQYYDLHPTIKGAKSLKDIEVVSRLDDCDVLINVSIGKHHFSTLYTGAIKNMMGVCTRKTNVFMHLGSGVKNDPEFLGQCLADINLFRPADLSIIDSSIVIKTGGPMGPGELLENHKIIAGADLVAVDALGCELLGYPAEEVISIVKAHEHGLGEIDYTKLKVIEV